MSRQVDTSTGNVRNRLYQINETTSAVTVEDPMYIDWYATIMQTPDVLAIAAVTVPKVRNGELYPMHVGKCTMELLHKSATRNR